MGVDAVALESHTLDGLPVIQRPETGPFRHDGRGTRGRYQLAHRHRSFKASAALVGACRRQRPSDPSSTPLSRLGHLVQVARKRISVRPDP